MRARVWMLFALSLAEFARAAGLGPFVYSELFFQVLPQGVVAELDTGLRVFSTVVLVGTVVSTLRLTFRR